MLKNLLRRFGYYKLNAEDKLVLLNYYARFVVKGTTKKRLLHINYLGIDHLTALKYMNYPNPVSGSYTCDQPDEK